MDGRSTVTQAGRRSSLNLSLIHISPALLPMTATNVGCTAFLILQRVISLRTPLYAEMSKRLFSPAGKWVSVKRFSTKIMCVMHSSFATNLAVYVIYDTYAAILRKIQALKRDDNTKKICFFMIYLLNLKLNEKSRRDVYKRQGLGYPAAFTII